MREGRGREGEKREIESLVYNAERAVIETAITTVFTSHITRTSLLIVGSRHHIWVGLEILCTVVVETWYS